MPISLQQLFESAIRHHNGGQFRQAQALYHQILAQDPTQVPVLQRLAQLAHQTNNHQAAEQLLRQAIHLDPASPDNHLNLGIILLSLNRPHDALAASRSALALRPNDSTILSNLGYMLYILGQTTEGIVACQRAIQLRPDYPEAHNNLGINLAAAGHPDLALAAYQKALALAPGFIRAYNNLSVSLEIMGRSEEAAAACQRALAIDPNFADAYTSLGNALQNLARHDEALAAYRKALALAPHQPALHSNYLFALSYHPATDARLLFEESRRWANSLPNPPITPRQFDRSPTRPLRIGYVSPDLRLHSVAYFLLPVLESHDPSSFHITCYPLSSQADEITARLRAASSAWHPLLALSPQDAANQIRRDNIDILIDLAGHTANNAIHLYTHRPAPLQLTWLGYPATTGLVAFDYRLTDALSDPPDPANDSLHTEKLLRLPQSAWCFSPLSGSPPITPSPHLSNNFITFGTLNSFAKLNDETLHLWAQLLSEVPHSHLAIKLPPGPETAARIHKIFLAHSVSPERLEFFPKLPDVASHLLRYHKIDIALDTFPYHGTTTTCEALWMGVPVITRTGIRHASRVGTSLLATLNLPDLITTTPRQFLETARNLATNSPRLQSLRTTLRPLMQSSPLMNAKQFTRQIESTYRQLWQTYCATSL